MNSTRYFKYEINTEEQIGILLNVTANTFILKNELNRTMFILYLYLYHFLNDNTNRVIENAGNFYNPLLLRIGSTDNLNETMLKSFYETGIATKTTAKALSEFTTAVTLTNENIPTNLTSIEENVYPMFSILNETSERYLVNSIPNKKHIKECVNFCKISKVCDLVCLQKNIKKCNIYNKLIARSPGDVKTEIMTNDTNICFLKIQYKDILNC